jgi:hypothetical protein
MKRETIMRLKLAVPLAAIACVVGASAFTATPGFAGDEWAYRHHHRWHHHYRDYSGTRDYSGYLDPSSGHYDPQFQRNRENFGFSGRDPSRVGGVDPTLNPPGLGR